MEEWDLDLSGRNERHNVASKVATRNRTEIPERKYGNSKKLRGLKWRNAGSPECDAKLISIGLMS